LENHNYQPIKELPKPLQTDNVAKFVTEYDDQLMLSLNDEEKLALILVLKTLDHNKFHLISKACGYLDFPQLLEICVAYEASKFIGI